MSKKRLICAVGINDADYTVMIQEIVGYVDGKRKRKLIWACPFYTTWKSMLVRCYSEKYQARWPTYIGCVVVEEWLTFSNFKAWMEQQDWQGKQLDKDLLVHGNKIYGPDHCVFVDRTVNIFMVERTLDRGECPIGVAWHKKSKKFQAQCCNPFNGKKEHLGLFTCPNEAHKAWLKRKQELAILLAAEQTDERIAKALVDRYSVVGYNSGWPYQIED